ncbi:MAG: hypothetical protein KGP01_07160, partial [Actinomycetales bacterium]|nr:hypothetical protein [Actinomycetales bacterium]
VRPLAAQPRRHRVAVLMNITAELSPVGQLHVGAGTTFGPLTVFPVWTSAPGARGFTTARGQDIQVSELDEPTVPQLLVWHNLDTDLLLLEGTLLVGGWQTRAAERDIVIPRGERVVTPVRCVERGRWGGGSGHGVDGIAPLSVRAALRGGAARRERADQSEVWERVTRLERTYGAHATSSLHSLMTESIGAPLHDSRGRNRDRVPMRGAGFVDELLLEELQRYAASPLPGQRGVIIGVGGSPVSLELFGSVGACKAELPALLTAAFIDAGTVNSYAPTRGAAARSFAEQCQRLMSLETLTWLPAAEGARDTETARTTAYDLDIRAIRRGATGSVLHASAMNMRHELALAL